MRRTTNANRRGPVTGARGFSPDGLAGLVGWWDFSDSSTLTLSMSEVTGLANKASGGGDATATGTGPTLTTSGGRTFGAFSVNPMAGTWDAATWAASWGATVIVAGRFTSNQGAMFSSNDGAANNTGFDLFRQSGNLIGRRVSPLRDTSVADADNTWRTQSGRFTDSATSLRISNSEVASSALASTGPDMTNYTIGQLYSAFGLAGEMGEILVYNRALTDPELASIETYLVDKWSL